MTILNPSHLLDQAERLIAAPSYGPPRQVDLRRAISTAYYGLFHSICTALANEFIGALHRSSGRYALMYRSLNHRTLLDVCSGVRSQQTPVRWSAYMPQAGFGPELKAFAEAVWELQQKRHSADYDPLPRYKTSDARLAIDASRRAILNYVGAAEHDRRLFLTLLLCVPR